MTHCRSFSFWLPLLALGILAGSARADTFTKVCVLRGGQEVPPVATSASGCGRFVIDTSANTLSYYVSFSGLTGAETMAHIHGPADPGVNGAILFNLALGNPKSGVWNYPEAIEADLLAGRLYVNLHSAGHGSGEVRGQIVDMVCVMDQAQEAPPTGSTGTGFGLFNVDRSADQLAYYIVIESLVGTETDAHIHGFSLHTVPAGIQQALALGSPKVGVWNYAAADEDKILNGQTYVNIHSTVNGGGEIRGQITNIVVPMDGSQEVGPIASPGHGCAFLAINPGGDALSYHVTYQDLTSASTDGHIHGFAAAGANAGIQHAFGSPNPALGVWFYPGASEANILAGLTYLNIHTMMHGGGEIRGQVLFPTERSGGPVGTLHCFGVGCPCGNDDPAAGCLNSSGAGGLLLGSGSTSVTNDDLVLQATQLPPNNQGLFYMGTALVNNPFFDGKQCALGTTWRFLCCIQGSGAGGTMVLGPGVAANAGGSIVSGSTWYFHCWFRDVPGSVCGTGANLTNVVGVQFTP